MQFIFAEYPTIVEIIANRYELAEIKYIGKKTQEAIITWAEEVISIEDADNYV